MCGRLAHASNYIVWLGANRSVLETRWDHKMHEKISGAQEGWADGKVIELAERNATMNLMHSDVFQIPRFKCIRRITEKQLERRQM